MQKVLKKGAGIILAVLVVMATFIAGFLPGRFASAAEEDRTDLQASDFDVTYVRSGSVFSFDNVLMFYISRPDDGGADLGDLNAQKVKFYSMGLDEYYGGVYFGLESEDSDYYYLYINTEDEDVTPGVGDYLVFDEGFELGDYVVADGWQILSYAANYSSGISFKNYDYKSTAAARIANLTYELSQAQLGLNYCQYQLNLINEQYQAALQEISELEAEIEELEAELAELREEDQSALIAALEAEIEGLAAQIEELESSNEDNLDQIAELEAQIEELEADIEVLEAELEALTAEEPEVPSEEEPEEEVKSWITISIEWVEANWILVTIIAALAILSGSLIATLVSRSR